MPEKFLFEEKQYLGLNRQSVIRRMVLALFCFLAYYWSENPKAVDVSGVRIGSYPAQDIPNSGELFFLMGIVILLLSTGMNFMLHIKTAVNENSIMLDGLWTSRKVKIPFSNIVSAQRVNIDRSFLNRPSYNLHRKGVIIFYTSGSEAVELTDKDGLKYRVGSQKTTELLDVINRQVTL